QLHRLKLAILAARPWASRDHLALHRLFLGRVGNDHAARRLFLGFRPPDHHTVVQRPKPHEPLLALQCNSGFDGLPPLVGHAPALQATSLPRVSRSIPPMMSHAFMMIISSQSSFTPLPLHSSPTRRSSDLSSIG